MTLITTQITQMISTVGFPIAAFLLMWRFSTTTLRDNTNALNNLALVLKK